MFATYLTLLMHLLARSAGLAKSPIMNAMIESIFNEESGGLGFHRGEAEG